MNIPAEFNEIRPYTPEELPQIYEELIFYWLLTTYPMKP